MALGLAMIILLGLTFNSLFEKIKLPGLLGMLMLGILMGPYGLNLINEELLTISADLRRIALIIILLRAGLGLNKGTLNKVGVPAIKMSFIPGLLEGFTIMVIARYLIRFSYIEAGILGFIIAAVSPAVIVPQMLDLINRKIGEDKGIPTLILAGASVDDVIAITLFTTFLGLYGGNHINLLRQLFNIPLSIVLGIVLGVLLGLLLVHLFRKYSMRDTNKALVILGTAIVFNSLEAPLEGLVPIASLLGVMTIGFVLMEKYPEVAPRVGSKFNKIWVFAQIMLFVLVGAEVNIYVAIDSGFVGIIIITIGLVARSIGVLISLAGTNLNRKERLFCVISYIPKATVQAAIGAVPLAMGVQSGEVILAIAVLSILVTAPLGAIGIKATGERWLRSVG
ncbi:cation:proton antiporter domain-containing protein [Alkaliphilus hydrothermalis]|uniref:NhaP-type Na+/H+ or K+/H+ antiporter n=1 Tax=Alkaliphilus hydrothermalis TaxID=1482730 RepID=A0ABS2NS64_9FIRM|nr:cation:proton antiporter [Alkaliphilus hydrothermalis]MBM7615761.1 NhaP-type Na+/H+ or K+/H+ antiporter [Alkaliphilus hydrothermalis]